MMTFYAWPWKDGTLTHPHHSLQFSQKMNRRNIRSLWSLRITQKINVDKEFLILLPSHWTFSCTLTPCLGTRVKIIRKEDARRFKISLQMHLKIKFLPIFTQIVFSTIFALSLNKDLGKNKREECNPNVQCTPWIFNLFNMVPRLLVYVQVSLWTIWKCSKLIFH